MSVKLFEDFLVESMVIWLSEEAQPGFRYQFKCPDSQNAERLYEALIRRSAQAVVTVKAVNLPIIDCNGTKLIIALHSQSEKGFTENYISFLRDKVAGRVAEFERTALLVIHNSMLDTLINSAMDLAEPDAVWNPEAMQSELSRLIDQRTGQELTQILLEDQLAMILEEGATIFGFAPLYAALADDGKLNFSELGLFKDDFILKQSHQQAQIRARLEENRKLRREIEYAVENYPDQLEAALKDYSPKFIKEHFIDSKDWRDLDYGVYIEEIRANSEQKLIFETIEVEGCTSYQRAKSQTKAGMKDISLIVEVPEGMADVNLLLTFLGSDLASEQVRVSLQGTGRNLPQVSVSRQGGKRSKLRTCIPFEGFPTYFSLDLKRENRSEQYQFRCLLLRNGYFNLDDIKNRFRVDSKNQWLTLQMKENYLLVGSEEGKNVEIETVDAEIDCKGVERIDFEQLASQTESIHFALKSGSHILKINVEGPPAEEALKLPFLFDQDRFGKLFDDKYNAEFNKAKGRIVVDNTEIQVVGVRLQLLNSETRIVEDRVLFSSPRQTLLLSGIRDISPSLFEAYACWFGYFDIHNTLPSLVSWGEEYCSLVRSVVTAYEEYLSAIPLSSVLSEDQKKVFNIGYEVRDDKERITPAHPLVLAYYLNLVEKIRADQVEPSRSSFAKLPEVTVDRMTVAGLLPFIFDVRAQFSHVSPISENQFWLDVVPQKEVSYSYVQRLVRDKLDEFTTAYGRLFEGGSKSTLIVNAINQGQAAELFLGLVDHFKRGGDKTCAVHVNFYDDRLVYNDFDRFSETASYEDLKERLGLNRASVRDDADLLIDLIRSRLTYSKFVTPENGQALAYAHLAFFKNNAPVDVRQVKIDDALSGVICDGLIAGEAAETIGNAYFTAFGLRGVAYKDIQPLRLAKLVSNLMEPARKPNSQYLGVGIGLAVSTEFKELLQRSYDSALWTTIIDPKVTLDFFTSQSDVVLIHYSDQYTSSASYDAITVTKQVELFRQILGRDSLLSEFNAFNGEWLLKLLTSNENLRKEKNGIIGAYKLISGLLASSDITWVPLSVAEMIRVAGNVGLKISESDFARQLQGYKKGAISDDVLFVGFKGESLFLLPLEVKTGSRPNYSYAVDQALELKRYLQDDILGPKTLTGKIFRGLFIRQVLMQLEKLRLYKVINDGRAEELLGNREWWLRGEYDLAELADYPCGFVVAHVDSDTCFEATFKLDRNILQVELPISILESLIGAVSEGQLRELVNICHVPERFVLGEAPLLAHAEDKAPEMPIEAVKEEKERGLDLVKNSLTEQRRCDLDDSRPQPPNTDWKNSPLKVLLGHEVMNQTPLLWEPTNTARFMNTNTGIIGTMGTGKTQFTKSLICQLKRNDICNVNAQPIGMLIFDYKSDYVDKLFLDASSAKKFNLFKLPYNPLSLYGDTPMLPVHTAGGFSETMRCAFGLGPKQEMRLRKLILDAYDLAGISRQDSSTWSKPAPTIKDLWSLFESQEKVDEDSLYAALSSLNEYEIFESDPGKVCSLYELIDGVNVIELAGYPPQIQNLVVALTLDLFYAQMQKRGKPSVEGDYRQITKMVLVDEADNFMSQNFASLRKILKEGREYGVGVILSTQDITHFKTGENDYSAYILTWVIHRVAQIRNSDVKAIFNKDDKGEQEQLMEAIRKLEKHQSLYVNGDKRFFKMRDKAFWELIS
jgi:DNA phosphorothioation-dependent restriction protein DptH